MYKIGGNPQLAKLQLLRWILVGEEKVEPDLAEAASSDLFYFLGEANVG